MELKVSGAVYILRRGKKVKVVGLCNKYSFLMSQAPMILIYNLIRLNYSIFSVEMRMNVAFKIRKHRKNLQVTE